MAKVIVSRNPGTCSICKRRYPANTRIVSTDAGWAEADCFWPEKKGANSITTTQASEPVAASPTPPSLTLTREKIHALIEEASEILANEHFPEDSPMLAEIFASLRTREEQRFTIEHDEYISAVKRQEQILKERNMAKVSQARGGSYGDHH